MLLEVRDLTVYYGQVRALHRVSFQVERGEIVAMIGPNGAGKSTALRAVCGLLEMYDGRVAEGEIRFKGRSILRIPPYDLVRLGIGFVPQAGGIFPSMTVYENLEMGGYLLQDRRQLQERIAEVFQLFPILEERKKQRAATLSGGEQQMLAMGKALILEPDLLVLDEPSAGLSPNYVEEVFRKIQAIHQRGIAILLVEQNARLALMHSDRAYVFQIGEIAKEGKSASLMEDPEIKRIYLGM